MLRATFYPLRGLETHYRTVEKTLEVEVEHSVFSAFVIEEGVDCVIDNGALSSGDIKIPQHHWFSAECL